MKGQKIFAVILVLFVFQLIGFAAESKEDTTKNEKMIAELKKEAKEQKIESNSVLLNEVIHSKAIMLGVPIVFFLVILLSVAIPQYFSYKKSAHLQKTIDKMVEKGVDILVELLTPSFKTKVRSSDLRKVILLIAIGLSISLFFILGPNDGMWTFGIIPIIIGCGYLVTFKLENSKKLKK